MSSASKRLEPVSVDPFDRSGANFGALPIRWLLTLALVLFLIPSTRAADKCFALVSAKTDQNLLPANELYDSVRPRLLRPLDKPLLGKVLSATVSAEQARLPQGAWLRLRYEMRNAEPRSRHGMAWLRLQRERISTSDTVAKSLERGSDIQWRKADDRVLEWIERGEPITAEHIKQLNEIVDQSRERGDIASSSIGVWYPWMPVLAPGGLPTRPGEYRKRPVFAKEEGEPVGSSARHPQEFIDYRDVPRAMADFERWYRLNEGALDPIHLAALSYRWLVTIHPFVNGNGRTARLVMDWILQKNGFPPAAIPPGYSSVASFGRAGSGDEAQWAGHERAVYSVRLGLMATCKIIKC